MSLAEARAAVAAALSTVSGLTVRTRPVATPKVGDGWVVVTRLAPAAFTACAATFTAVVILGADEAAAEGLLETYGVACIDAVTSRLQAADVSLEAQVLLAGTTSTPLYAIAVTLTLEV